MHMHMHASGMCCAPLHGVGELHISKPTWWLESRFHFSFADWFTSDPARQSFGALRVVNDDLVKAHSGFGCVCVSSVDCAVMVWHVAVRIAQLPASPTPRHAYAGRTHIVTWKYFPTLWTAS